MFSDYYIQLNILVRTQEKSVLFSIISYFQLAQCEIFSSAHRLYTF